MAKTIAEILEERKREAEAERLRAEAERQRLHEAKENAARDAEDKRLFDERRAAGGGQTPGRSERSN